MTDIRSRHVKHDDGMPGDPICLGCYEPWPCDAIIEADDKDKLLARCQELAERLDEEGAEVVEQSDRADKAEAALAAERRQYGVAMKAMLEREAALGAYADALGSERDAARADAKALAETMEVGKAWFEADDKMRGEEGNPFIYWMKESDRLRIEFWAAACAALAAHKEVS
jgi:hypothetical protein